MMTQIYIWIIVSLFSSVPPVFSYAVTHVKWETETKMIRLGGTVALVCTVHGHEFINPEETRKWFKESNLAVFNGQTTNPLKYKESNERNEFTLHILNVTESDLISTYTCVYSFKSHTSFIQLTEENFEHPPTEQDVTLEYDYATNHILSVKLHFKKVFPVPTCIVSIEGSQVTFTERHSQNKGGLCFKVDLLHQSKHIFIEHSIYTVICKFNRATRVMKTVTWEAETKMIRVGETVALVCAVHGHAFINPKETRKWFKESDLASYNGQTTNPLKYKESKTRNKITLYIFNVTEADLMSSYTCLYSFQSYTAFIQLTGENFEYPITENEVKLDIEYARNSKSSVKLYFKKVFPEPACTIFIQGSQLTFPERIFQGKGLYFEGHLLYQTYRRFLEETPVSVICKYKRETRVLKTVIWETETKMIRFGGTVALVCTVHGHEFINPEETRKWFKESDLTSYNGETTNPLKYKESNERNRFKLYIYNVTEEDLISRYSCVYSFKSYTAFIKLTEENFEYPPTENNINLDYDYATNDILSVKLHFEKVFPKPNCTVSIEGLQLTFEEISYESKGLYLEGHLHHQSKHTFKKDTPFTVTCKLQLEYTFFRETRVIQRVIPLINSGFPFENPFPKVLLGFVITVTIGVRLVDY